MPLIRDHPQQPLGGHLFADPSGHSIRAKDIDVLLARIIDYRRANGLPPGNPEAEVERDYRTRFPWLVSNVGTIATPPEDPVTKWVKRLWKLPPKKWVETVEREARAETCITCPHHKEWTPGVDLGRRITIIGAGRERGGLGRCSHFNTACGLMVAIQDHDLPDAPACCWLTGCGRAAMHATPNSR